MPFCRVIARRKPIARVFNITQLEKETGVSRTTIHFYIREGLLPKPQKPAASRSLYGEQHVTLLHKIGDLKRRGHSLGEIKLALELDLAAAEENAVDLAGQESGRIRREILRVATRDFLNKGYKQTHISAIIRELGITPQIFYSHFPSKPRLVVECFHTFFEWNVAHVEPRALQTQDLGERLLWRMLADDRANMFGSEVFSVLRSETANDKGEMRKIAERAWSAPVDAITADFKSVRPAGASPSLASLEVVAYCVLGAQHNATIRVSWDDEFSRADLLRTHLWLVLAVHAALAGEIDIDARVARYEELIQEFARRKPEIPPPPVE